jgi:hypothetical protein
MALWATLYAGIAATRYADHCRHPVSRPLGYVRVVIQAWLFATAFPTPVHMP